jgi:hypothetical protein
MNIPENQPVKEYAFRGQAHSDIEKSIGTETDRTILDKVLDAENCLLEMQREMMESLRHEPRHDVIRRLAPAILAA